MSWSNSNSIDFSQIITKIKGHVNLLSNDYYALINAVATKGPIAITVDASSWFGYKSGVFDGCAN
jgi:cathepsin L